MAYDFSKYLVTEHDDDNIQNTVAVPSDGGAQYNFDEYITTEDESGTGSPLGVGAAAMSGFGSAATDGLLGLQDTVLNFVGNKIMPNDRETSPLRAAYADALMKYNPFSLGRRVVNEKVIEPLQGMYPHKEYDPEGGFMQFATDPYAVAQGLGSMAGFMVGGAPVRSMVGSAASRLGMGLAGKGLTAAAGGVIEGVTEASNVYDDVMKRSGNENEAIMGAAKTLALNVPIDVATNYFGLAAENRMFKSALFKALSKVTMGKLPEAVIGKAVDMIAQAGSGTLGETAQETLQSVVSNKYGEGLPWGDVVSPEALRRTFVTEGLPGGVVGALTGGAFGAFGNESRDSGGNAEVVAEAMQRQKPAAAPSAWRDVVSKVDNAPVDEVQSVSATQRRGASPATIVRDVTEDYQRINSISPEQRTPEETAAFELYGPALAAFKEGRIDEGIKMLGDMEFEEDAVSESPSVQFADGEQVKIKGKPEPTEESLIEAKADVPASAVQAPPYMVRYRDNGEWRETPVRYGLREADELITSNTEAGGVNEAYPQELQPRDRSRMSSAMQIAQMARDLKPELLGEDPGSDRGAPILDGRDNVISGNGRALALISAYKNLRDSSGKRYVEWLRDNAERFGLSAADVVKMKNPVLTRTLLDDKLDLKAFAEDANTPVVAGMSAAEQAQKDAGRLSPEVLGRFVLSDSGDVLAGNGAFVDSFKRAVVEKAEQDRFIGRDGRVSQDGVRRIKNALFAKAYGDIGALERMSESTDDGMRNVTNALTQAAPAMALTEERMERGLLDRSLSLRGALSEALRTLEYVREQGMNVSEVLNQQNLFGPQLSPAAKVLVQFIDGNKRSANRIRQLFMDYAAAVEERGDPRQRSMFDDGGVSIAGLLERMAAKQGQTVKGESTAPAVKSQGKLDFYGDDEAATVKPSVAEDKEPDGVSSGVVVDSGPKGGAVSIVEQGAVKEKELPKKPHSEAQVKEVSSPVNTDVSPQERLARRVFKSLKDGNAVKDNVMLSRMADEAWGGTQAEGRYDISQAYDAMEMGLNLYLRSSRIVPSTLPSAAAVNKAVKKVNGMLDRLPTMSNRSERKESFQQFSTPPNYSVVANWLLGTRPGDVVLEPSAGVGGLAVFAKNAGAKVYVNELDPQRAALLERMGFDGVFQENAEQLHNILSDEVKPNRIIMNPPFSSTAGRTASKSTKNAIPHIEQALSRLEDGGRAVMILGKGMADDAPAFKDFWNGIKKRYNVRANVELSGKEYRKYGTTFGNVMAVVDKTGPTPQDGTITGKFDSLTDVARALEGVALDGRNLAGGTETAGRVEPEGRGEGGIADTEARDTGEVSLVEEPASDAGGLAGRGDEGVSEPASGGKAGLRKPGHNGYADKRPAAGVGRGGGGLAGGGGIPVGYPQRGGVSEGEEQPQVDGDAGLAVSGSGDSSSRDGKAGGGRSVQDDRPGHGKEGSLRLVSDTAGEAEPAIKSKEEILKELEKAKPSEDEDESLFDNYVSPVKGAPHPADLAEPAAMAAVKAPVIKVKLKLGKAAERVSAPQQEAIARAAQAFEATNPDGTRRGFFIGDGTGVGKGREISGIITDQLNKGYGNGKALWLSIKHDLAKDARRDWEDIGGDGDMIIPHEKVTKGKKELDPSSKGVLFSAYSFFASGEPSSMEKAAKKRDRIGEIKAWLGKDFDGVIALDECHDVNNVVDEKGSRGKKSASKRALAVRDLIREFPNARVVYVSATGATEIKNLAMLERLGLWGEGTSFPTMGNFLAQIGKGGTTAMELVARDMKAMGLYIARSLSFRAGPNGGPENVTFSRLEHPLADHQRAVYNEIAKSWQVTLQNVHKALEKTKGGNGQANYSQFYGSMQRMFNQILTSMSVPSVITSIENDLKNGNSVVIQLTNTDEAGQKKAEARLKEGDTVDDLDITPKDNLLSYLERSFPVDQYEEFMDEEGNLARRQVFDSKGNPVVNKEALAARDELIEHVNSIKFPDSPIDMIIKHFGADNVAEVTGRTRRPNYERKGEAVTIARNARTSQEEAAAFQRGDKRILIFSDAGGTGFSYHADRTKENQQKRIHYLLQPGWKAAQAIQGLGRTMRSNQAHKPHVVLATTDVPGQKRFISTIARRLEQLGALTQGDRGAQNKGLFNEADNLEGRQSSHAVERLFSEHRLDDDVIERMGLSGKYDKDGNFVQPVEVNQFLNRVLALDLDSQSQVFREFESILGEEIERAIEKGTLDTGTRNLRADSLKVLEDRVVYKDSGVETRYVKLEAGFRQHPRPFHSRSESGFVGYYHQKKSLFGSGRVLVVYEKASETLASGEIVKTYSIRGVEPSYNEVINEKLLRNGERYEKLSTDRAHEMWNAEASKLPKMRMETRHMLTGAILPIYSMVDKEGGGGNQIVKARLSDGTAILGLQVSDKRIGSTLRNLGVMKGNAAASKEDVQRQVSSEDIISGVLQSDSLYELANGWKLKRSRVLGENRLELVGPDFFSDKVVQTFGIRKERIGGHETRYFVPTGHPAALDMLLRYSPVARVVDRKGNESYRLSPASQRDAALKHFMISGKPVAKLTGNEFQTLKGEIWDDVAEYFQRLYKGKVFREGLGDVFLSKKGVKGDVYHGTNPIKNAAFAAVPEVVKQGKILRVDPNWKGRGYRSFVIGAPIEIKGDRYLAMAVVNEATDSNSGRTHGNFYLHEVVLQKNLLSTGTAQLSPLRSIHRSSAGSPSPRGDIYTLLSYVINVNSLPAVTADMIAPHVPKGFTVRKLAGGQVSLEGQNGFKIVLSNLDSPMEVDPDVVRRDYGREATPDDFVSGRTRVLDKRAFIDLVNGMSTPDDFNHEVYEVARSLLMSDAEREVMAKDFPSKEAEAEGYASFMRGRMEGMKGRVGKVFMRMRDFFSRLRASIFGPRSEDIFRDIANGRLWAKELRGDVSDSVVYRISRYPGVVSVSKEAREEMRKAEYAPPQSSAKMVAHNTEALPGRMTKKGATQWQKVVDDHGLEKVVERREPDMSLKERIVRAKEWTEDNIIDREAPIARSFGKDIYRMVRNGFDGISSKAEHLIKYGKPKEGAVPLSEVVKDMSKEEREGFLHYAEYKNLLDVAGLTDNAIKSLSVLEDMASKEEEKAKVLRRDMPFDEKDKRDLERAAAGCEKYARQLRQQADQARRYIRETRGKAGDYKAAIAAMDELYPHWQERQEQLVGYGRYLLAMKRDAGMISDDLYDFLESTRPNYVPAQRDFSEEGGVGAEAFIRSRGLVNLTSPLKKMKGSKRDIVNPIDELITDTFRTIALKEQQAAATAIIERYSQSEEDSDAEPLLWRTLNTESSPTRHVFYVWRNGEKEYYATHDRAMYEAITMYSSVKAGNNPLTRALSLPARMLRAGTAKALRFALGRNLQRDNFQAAVYGKGYRPFYDFFKGAMHVVKGDAVFQDFLEQGGAQGLSSVGRDRMKELKSEIYNERERNPIKATWNALGKLTEISELGTRVGQYERALDLGMSKEEAVYTARDLMNFMIGGRITKVANQQVPFLTAGIQDLNKLYRAHFHDGKFDMGTVRRGVMWLTMPSLALWFWNNGDDDRRKKYQSIENWKRNSFWWIILNKDVAIPIAKPFSLGMIYASLPERFMDYWVGKDRRAVEGFGKTLFAQMMPGVMPLYMSLLVELGLNRSFFYERDIVPQSEQKLEPYLQYGPYTTEWAKAAGRITGWSPRKIEYAVYGVTGSLGKEVSGVVNNIWQGATGISRPAKEWYEYIPGSEAFISSTRHFRGPVDRWNDNFPQLEMALKTAQTILQREGAGALSDRQRILLTYEQDVRNILKLNSGKGGIWELQRAKNDVAVRKDLTARQKREIEDKLNARIIMLSEIGLNQLSRFDDAIDSIKEQMEARR